MDQWHVVGVHDDTDSSDGERWLITYQVPLAYAPDGFYSASIPKGLVNNWAALYDYDVDDPQELDELLDYVLYTVYMDEVLRKEGRRHELVSDPFGDPAEAKASIRAHLKDFKKARPLVQTADAKLQRKAAAGKSVGDLHDVIKQDMKSRIDREAIGETKVHAHRARERKAMGRQR